MKKNIALFTPMANEEKNAKKFILKILKYRKYFNKFKYFIILDNASRDNTYKINITHYKLYGHQQIKLQLMLMQKDIKTA